MLMIHIHHNRYYKILQSVETISIYQGSLDRLLHCLFQYFIIVRFSSYRMVSCIFLTFQDQGPFQYIVKWLAGNLWDVASGSIIHEIID